MRRPKWWRKIFDSSNPEEIEEDARGEVEEILQLESGEYDEATDDRYSRFRGTPLMSAIAPSGIWVVIKFSDALEAGGVGDMKKAQIIKSKDGQTAIMEVYTADVSEHGSRANLVNAKGEDGRYVALDFYTGHRVEALVRGGWKAELEVAR